MALSTMAILMGWAWDSAPDPNTSKNLTLYNSLERYAVEALLG